jgi:hypothetical protein
VRNFPGQADAPHSAPPRVSAVHQIGRTEQIERFQ